ncbi:MAG: 3-phosphoshikimate 1-carboxyvinyltransferase [Gemmatimonadaceae bacterium]
MRVSGRIAVPGDKSISHRALILGALASGTSRVRGVLQSADVRSTAEALRAMGAGVPALASTFAIDGRGRRGLCAPASALDCGNSGTSARLLAGVVAGHPISARFEGDASLSVRPMRRVATPLARMGAAIELERGDGLPMTVRGGDLCALEWQSEIASAQVKSAILLAALTSGVTAGVSEPERSRDHTERMLASMGAPVTVADLRVQLDPVARLEPLELDVPGDPSSAAFFVALAALATTGELCIERVCLNPTRTGFFRAVGAMGARVDVIDEAVGGGEPIGSLVARPAHLRAIHLAPDGVASLIDEIPLLACLAARAEGTTVITGAGELRVKESDRIAVVIENLRELGVDAEELPDGMRITGSDRPLRGRVRTHGDHRIAMAFGILGADPSCRIDLDDRECVGVSYPRFWEDLGRVVSR